MKKGVKSFGGSKKRVYIDHCPQLHSEIGPGEIEDVSLLGNHIFILTKKGSIFEARSSKDFTLEMTKVTKWPTPELEDGKVVERFTRIEQFKDDNPDVR